jgi:hypothetical protein
MRILLLFFIAFWIQTTSAEPPIEAVNAINYVGSSTLSNNLMGENAGGVLLGIMRTFLPLANLVSVLILILTGLLLAVSQDENQVSVARKTIFAVVAALVLINVAGPIALSFTTAFDEARGAAAGAAILSTEVLGFINFIEVPIASLAIVMIIVSSIRAVAAFGTDQGTTHMRRTLFSVVVGIVLISSKIALATAIGANPIDVFLVGNPDAHPLIDVALSMLRIVLSFMALSAVVVIIISGIMLIVNKGDQETANKARGILIRSLMGLLVILISGGLTMIVLA